MAAGTDFGADGEAVNPGRRRGANVNRQRADARSGSSGRAELTDYWLACFVCFAWSAAASLHGIRRELPRRARQVARVARLAMAFEIGGGAHQQDADAAQTAGQQAGIRQPGDAQRQIRMVDGRIVADQQHSTAAGT